MAPKVQPDKFLVYIASIFAITLWGMSYIWTDQLIAQNIPIFYFGKKSIKIMTEKWVKIFNEK